ncbi:MAG TPA: phenylalanine--tRNA ligase subunit beta [Candidatus Angelobacter sp.]|nr:phenylalanine--tRNA ligase subunit beta [Candidatus Angelobacter sp.]
MIISLNWLKKFTDINLPVDELVTLIGARLVEIEKVIDLGAKYKDVLIAKVVEANKLDGSDHLSVTKIDDGGTVKDIERDEKGLIQVVCGAPNIKAGQLIAWLPPKSIVPETYNKPEPFVLDTRELRGVKSNGMVASARELDLFDEHDGILEIDADVKLGASFAKTYELDDYLFDIENKSLTHRPDCFGVIGFAREVANITGKAFKTPEWLMNISPDFNKIKSDEIKLNVAIDDPDLSRRYMAVVMSNIDSKKQSSLQIQTYLSRVGVRPINLVVDVTNYLMMLTGQPLHAFDYDKLIALNDGKADIHVRAGHDGEDLILLDDRTIKLTSQDIIIASGETAIGLAGAMGGANTVIDENTCNIIIESATFNLYKLRATQMRHGIFSEAITRFTKGQPVELNAPVLNDAIRLMSEWAGAKCASDIVEAYPAKNDQIVFDFAIDKINDILGSKFTDSEVIDTLHNAEFIIEQAESQKVKIKVPYLRADIHIVEDIAEEIGRLNGFDNVKPILPMRDFTAVVPDDFDDFRNMIRKILVRAGANEVLTYSFVHSNILQKVGQKLENSYRVSNSISPDLQYYRQTLTPSLLDIIHPNIRQGYDSFALFEINKTHQKQDGLNSEGVPNETDMMALVITSKNKLSGAPYYQAKRTFDYLCESLGLELIYEKIDKELGDSLTSPFEYRHSARVVAKAKSSFIGIVGEYKKSIIKGFKLPKYTAGFEINTRTLFEAVKDLGSGYKPLSRYPASERDICFQVDKQVPYGQIIDAAKSVLKDSKMETTISPVDIYQPNDGDTKNITIRVKLTSHDHTLTGDEVTAVIDSLIASVTSKTHATVI